MLQMYSEDQSGRRPALLPSERGDFTFVSRAGEWGSWCLRGNQSYDVRIRDVGRSKFQVFRNGDRQLRQIRPDRVRIKDNSVNIPVVGTHTYDRTSATKRGTALNQRGLPGPEGHEETKPSERENASVDINGI